MLAQVFDEDLKKLSSSKTETEGHRGAEDGLERMIQTLEEALDEAGIKRKELAGVGVACPGPVDPDNGVLLQAPNLGWKNTPVRKELENAFKSPVVLVNDVDAGVYAEYKFGSAKGARCVVGLFPGTGIGGGAVLNGQIIEGAASSCMEIGHIPVLSNGPFCGCGKRGCLETMASRLAIGAAVSMAAYRGQAPHLLAACGTGLSKIKSGKIAEAIEAGDSAVEEIVREAAYWLGIGTATVIQLLAPDTIVLGGGLVQAMPDLWVTEVQKTARDRVLPTYRKAFKVVPAQLADDATVLGSVAWAQSKIAAKDD